MSTSDIYKAKQIIRELAFPLKSEYADLGKEADMSTDNKSAGGGKKKAEKYMWLGFGNYSGGGLQGPINPGNIRADPGIFNKLLELFGLKEKSAPPKGEKAEEVRDPNW